MAHNRLFLDTAGTFKPLAGLGAGLLYCTPTRFRLADSPTTVETIRAHARPAAGLRSAGTRRASAPRRCDQQQKFLDPHPWHAEASGRHLNSPFGDADISTRILNIRYRKARSPGFLHANAGILCSGAFGISPAATPDRPPSANSAGPARPEGADGGRATPAEHARRIRRTRITGDSIALWADRCRRWRGDTARLGGEGQHQSDVAPSQGGFAAGAHRNLPAYFGFVPWLKTVPGITPLLTTPALRDATLIGAGRRDLRFQPGIVCGPAEVVRERAHGRRCAANPARPSTAGRRSPSMAVAGRWSFSPGASRAITRRSYVRGPGSSFFARQMPRGCRDGAGPAADYPPQVRPATARE